MFTQVKLFNLLLQYIKVIQVQLIVAYNLLFQLITKYSYLNFKS